MGKPLVVGIDLGMTYTGVAYAWDENMDVKFIQEDWPGSEGVPQRKVPTIVVYKKSPKKKSITSKFSSNKMELSSWGFQAQEESEASDPNNEVHKFWKLFLDKGLVKDLWAAKQTDPPFSQKDIARYYEDFLTALYEHIETHFLNIRPKAWDAQVKFVFSVPTTWNEDVMDLFKTCFVNAGFGKAKGHTAEITLTEAQAAAVCTAKEQSDEFEKGEKLLVVDAGGGTTDIAVLEVASGRGEPLKLKQIDKVSGKRAGSTQIDTDFEAYAKDQIKILHGKHPGMVKNVDIAVRSMAASRIFQVQKCTLGSNVSTVPFGVPVPGCQSDFSCPEANIKNGKLTFTPKQLSKFFDERLKTIFDAVDTQFENIRKLNKSMRVDYMVLSGGLGSSAYIKNKLEQRYCKDRKFSNAANMTILKAESPQLVVAKGLVIDHLRKKRRDSNGTSVLQNWISPKSYGVLCMKKWDHTRHLPQDKEYDEVTRKTMARNQIEWIIKKGDSLDSNTVKSQTAMRTFRADGQDYDDIWESRMVVSDLDVHKLPHSKSQGGIKHFCTIESDLSAFQVDDFDSQHTGWIPGFGTTIRAVTYELRFYKGPADIKFELWYEGKKRSEEKKGLNVDWDHGDSREEVP